MASYYRVTGDVNSGVLGCDMKLAVVSHAYVQPGYLQVFAPMCECPSVDLALLTPQRFRFGLHAAPCDFVNSLDRLRSFGLPTRFAGRQGTFVYSWSALSSALSEFQPDILLHEQEVYSLGATQVAAMASRRSVPLVMFVWENVQRSLSWPRRRMRDFVLDHCAGLLVGSEGAARVHREWGFTGPIAVVPQMGVAAVNPSPVYGRRNGPRFRVMFAGRLVPEKGIDCLLRAVGALRNFGVDAIATITGRGPELPRLTRLTEELGLRSSVEFTGAIAMAKVRELLGQSDVLVLPSRSTPVWEEQFGRILVEAMAEGTVTVGSRTGAIPEVIGNNQLTFAENDAEGLSRILERLGSNEQNLVTHQKALWERAANSFTNGVLWQRRLTFLGQILAR
jgi:glycosyltransferase involved in cell wall biosynthesis